MTVRATHTTAAIAGAWTVFGLVTFEMWMEHHKVASAASSNILWLLALLVFLLVPAYYLVLGQTTEAFDRLWFKDPEERARYATVVKRMFTWFVTAGVVGSLWSLLLSFVIGNG